MPQIRRAETTWDGNLVAGHGGTTAATSHAFTDLPVTWASRTEAADGRTSPEELLAAAHATCFAMAFSSDLTKNGTPPNRLEASATITFDKLDQWTVVSSAVKVRGWVPGIDVATFERIAEGTRDNCPISRAIKGNVELSVEATLER